MEQQFIYYMKNGSLAVCEAFYIFKKMIRIEDFLDATYLKTPEEENVSQKEYDEIVREFLSDAISHKYKAIMIRPENVEKARKLFSQQKTKVLVGTVIDFPYGTADLNVKLDEARNAIENGADELDFVLNYEAFKKGEIGRVKEEILQCTDLCLKHHKTIKWIIETAALNDTEIIRSTVLIKNTVIANFKETDYARVFVKSSTGLYEKEKSRKTGATLHALTLMLENATPLPVKASGGIRELQEVLFYIDKGVKRIGTSASKELVKKYYGS